MVAMWHWFTRTIEPGRRSVIKGHLLTVIDEFTRTCLAIVVARWLNSDAASTTFFITSFLITTQFERCGFGLSVDEHPEQAASRRRVSLGLVSPHNGPGVVVVAVGPAGRRQGGRVDLPFQNSH